jgi:hypothetical protein
METQNKSNGNKSLAICFMLALALIFLCSCGARKTERSKEVTKETIVTQSTKTDSSKVVTVSDTNAKIVDNGTEEEFSITPIDSTKEMVVSGKTYFNAKLSHKKTSNNKVVENKAIVTETRQNDIKEAVKTQISKAKSVEVKKTDRKANYWWLLWLLLLIPIYFAYKKYSKFLPF